MNLDFFQKTTGLAIVRFINKSPGLRAKQIYSEIRKGGNSTSYQNIHKILKALERNRVLETKNKQYYLAKEWVKGIKKLAEELN